MTDLEKDLLACIDLKKLSVIIVEKIVIGSLEKVVADSSNKIDDVIFAELAPILKVKAEEELNVLIAKIGA